jgi:hypothetical protein
MDLCIGHVLLRLEGGVDVMYVFALVRLSVTRRDFLATSYHSGLTLPRTGALGSFTCPQLRWYRHLAHCLYRDGLGHVPDGATIRRPVRHD